MSAKLPPSFSYLECLSRARATLAAPPKWEWTRRVEPQGDLVAQFALPLELCPTSNQRMRGGIGQRRAEAALKRSCLKMMQGQCLLQMNPVRMLRGRPQVIATRFSAKESDANSDWSKVPCDRLIDLGLIEDDGPRWIDLVTTCEYAPPQRGFVWIRVYTGE
jgi:hypothetical protein